ncbi:MAG: hypothetical protein OZ913_08210 [Ignavibacteriaceae bacterium]|jgi:hypothetical protein|nr:MAG: hypothetical protein EDM69_03345 [Chlorobiota bacterium]KXK05801.1 MAG: hypothetical protein UZ04_CHB001000575 [Chlorobi bacterium OLB4]MBV6398368.1 hypothetical protein [Ignavibacteria bacterium]MCC6886041.1 hypothetical protein [Ignavibacteriales bacterium]MCE7952709.1 hypothetical protein [Chlorobi bacterium CHB7]MDL1886819.1 hypothetical protein [Ignavibacteria bacterium CHB1]MEB2330271.1 hypothetical protein [Ignavibacteriaceae bacterium]OQY77850.1 MAG: hypothetical protein B6D4
MNPTHVHLLVNHFSLLIPVIGLAILISGFIFKSEVVKQTALALFIAGAILTLPAKISGENAEDEVEKIPEIEHTFVEEHEDAAKRFAIFSYILGAISLIGFWASKKQKTFANIIALIVILFSFVVLYMGWVAGNTGGEIRHPEIRSGSVQLFLNENNLS